jgi:hypothetical protein
MAKKQTRRSISVSKSTYERLKAYCEINSLSMSQFVEERVGDFLGRMDRHGRQVEERMGRVETAAAKRQPAIFTF